MNKPNSNEKKLKENSYLRPHLPLNQPTNTQKKTATTTCRSRYILSVNNLQAYTTA